MGDMNGGQAVGHERGTGSRTLGAEKLCKARRDLTDEVTGSRSSSVKPKLSLARLPSLPPLRPLRRCRLMLARGNRILVAGFQPDAIDALPRFQLLAASEGGTFNIASGLVVATLPSPG